MSEDLNTTGMPIPRPFEQLPRLARETTADNPWPVSVLSQKFHTAVEKWPAAWICGQITEINTRRAGSAYLTVRDDFEDIAISVSGWRAFAAAASQFRQGDRVVIHGHADIWVKQTRFELHRRRHPQDRLRRRTEGADRPVAHEAQGQGPVRRGPQAAAAGIPLCIGLICAPHARAKGDVITNVRLRWPTVRFNIVHAFVQGPQCPQSIVEAIHRLDADPDVDVIIVARGGGSFEDLIGFSDEAVVRATAGCETPIVSAIGHEDDWTLIDLAADLRASTPTDAAKKVVPDVHEQWQLIGNAIDRMRMRIDARVGNEIRLVEGYANRPSLTQPLTMLEPYQRFVDDARRRMDIGLTRIVDDASLTVEKLHASLTALSPQSTLDRGYAVVQNADGHVIDDAGKVSAGDHLTLTLRKGVITATAQ